MELGVRRDAYDNLVDDLQWSGWDARIEAPAEQRGGGLHHAAVDLVVQVLDEAGRTAIDVVVAALLARLGRSALRRKRTRRAVIFGPDGEVLRELELRDGGHDDAA